jgi:hypothetical protein
MKWWQRWWRSWFPQAHRHEPAELKDGTVVQDRRLDRIPQFDARSLNFPVRTLIPQAYPPRSYTWSVPVNLNQGAEGACVGFGFAHELAARPASVPGMTNDFARQKIYWRAQQLDPWAGGAYPNANPFYEGTSVLAGAQVCTKELKLYGAYHWAFSLDDVIMALGYKGPVVLGVNWYEGMWDTDALGFIRVRGALVGGHCILAHAVDLRNKRVSLFNSWGKNWGIGGKAWISFADLDRLLKEQGEACVPTLRVVKA